MKNQRKKINLSKLVYPNNGIYSYCQNNLENISNNISNAISNCVFDIPIGFTYTSYLNSLNDVLVDYSKELDSIDSKLKKTNDNYELLEEDLENEAKKLVSIKIKERDRMIV